MAQFSSKRIDGKAAADWPAIHRAAARHDRSIIEVRAYDPEKEISLAQMAYWHSVPIKEFSEHTGYTEWKSEQWLKRECGEIWFMKEVNPEEDRRGQIMFECLNAHCRQLFVLPSMKAGKYICPTCHTVNIRMFFMLSKTELSIRAFNQVLENTWDFMASINRPVQAPDKAWRVNQLQEASHG